MNVFRVLGVSAAVGGVLAAVALGIQSGTEGDAAPPPGQQQDGQVGDPATPGTGSGEVDDPDPNDLDPNDLDPDDPEVQDPEIQDPELDDPDPDDPDPGIPGPPGARGPAGTSSNDPDPDDPDPDDPEIQDPEIQEGEIQDPEVDDPDPGGITCPDGFAADELTLNAPGGQVTLFVCIAI